MMESGLELHVFLHRFFLLYLYFPAYLEKRIEQPSPQKSEPTLSVRTIEYGVSYWPPSTDRQVFYFRIAQILYFGLPGALEKW